MLFRKLFAVLILTVAFMAVLPLSGVFATATAVDVQPQSQTPDTLGPNLLTNPGMDGKYVKQCSPRNGPQWVQVPCPANYEAAAGDVKQWETVQVPYGWSAWWRQPNNNFNDPNYFNTYPDACPDLPRTPADCKAWHNPEFRDTLGGPQEYGPVRRVAGDNAQKYFTFYSVHEAGMYQVVSGVKPGDRLRFSVYMEAWSNGVNDPFKSDLGQRMNLQVGIDPTGGNDPWSPNIIWTAPADSFDAWNLFVVEAVAKNSVVSVWTKSKPEMPLQHVDVYLDEASLNVVQSSRATKAPARSTRVVTSTKIITSTRLVTDTDGVVSSVVITESVVMTKTVTPTPATRVMTATKIITRANGITMTVITTRTVVVTPTPARVVTTTNPTKPVTSTKVVTPTSSTKPVTSTTTISGTEPIPASGTYTIQKGDSLTKIARRFGLTVAKLIALNSDLITDPDRIEAGWVLKLR